MKIIFLIDNLGSGGAQKQVYLLARHLKEIPGMELIILCYHEYNKDFYSERLEAAGIKVLHNSWVKYNTRIANVKKVFSKEKPDVVISYLYGANLLACLVKIISRHPFKLIVSDRTGIYAPADLKDKIRYNMYRIADYVTVNSSHTETILKERAPFLKNKIRTIWNIVEDTNTPKIEKEAGIHLKIVMGASYSTHKNHLLWIRGIGIGVEKYNIPAENVRVECYGSKYLAERADYMKLLEAEILKYGLKDSVFLFNEKKEINLKIAESDFCALASLYEGCPNFIIEAMMQEKPVLLSDVSANKTIVPAEGGFFFDPNSPEEIAEAFYLAFKTKLSERIKMGRLNRERALKMFNPQEKVANYLELFK